MYKTRLDEHKHKIHHIGGSSAMYSFPELLPEIYRGNNGDIRRDYNVGYFLYSFHYLREIDKVSFYYSGVGKEVSFEEVFNACCEETQEYILFNLDFFRPTR